MSNNIKEEKKNTEKRDASNDIVDLKELKLLISTFPNMILRACFQIYGI
jgi:hypothetical protein